MTNKTEDRFYFGKPDVMATPMGEHGVIGKLVSRAIREGAEAYRAGKPAVLNARDPKYKGMSAKELEIYGNFWMRGWMGESIKDASAKPIGRGLDLPGMRFSRPGQPERFAIGNKDTMATLNEFEKLLKPHWDVLSHGETRLSGTHDPRNPDNDYRYQAKRAIADFVSACVAGPKFAKQIIDDIRVRVNQYIDHGRDKSVPQYRAAVQIAKALDAIRGPLKSGFSRPGQPDKFDASSLERGSFAEASKSPMLGKLISEKAMPEGGWRAVQAGSDTLVISFEDGDVAGNFARRVAGKGYSATSPVQAIGRYWNVEVKNGGK